MKVGLVRDSLFTEHSNGAGHPERPERLSAVDTAVGRSTLGEHLVDLPARDAEHADLARIHDEAYIRRVADTDGARFRMLDPDTGAGPKSYRAAVRAAGAAMTAVDAVLSGEVKRAFALPRPPGHHAERNRAMGFCLFNSVAVAARYAQERHGVERVAIVDWDVHHGNGTQWSFYEDPSVLYLSLHQYPLFPGTGLLEDKGRGPGQGTTVNVPLPAGQADADYALATDRIVIPVLDRFEPELLLVSAGFDAHRDDPLAQMRLTTEGFRRMTRALRAAAAEHTAGRMVHVLEGGYNLEALGEGVVAVLEELSSEEETPPHPAVGPESAGEGVREVLSRHWALQP